MQQIATHADIVIYDSPPATTVTDATILAQHVDAVIHVIRAGSTPINHVLHCKTMLTQVGAPIFGTVLNQVRVSDLSQSSYYYYYHYHQEYGDSANGPLWRKLLRGGKKKRDSQSAHVSP
jgi:Mrp family chromosome partitioning ATPase